MHACGELGDAVPPDPLRFIALELETAGTRHPDQAWDGPLFTGIWWRWGQPSTDRPLALDSTTCIERPCRLFDSSAFARPSGFANYKLSAFANYSRPLLLAPRQVAVRCGPVRRRKRWTIFGLYSPTWIMDANLTLAAPRL